MTGVRYIPLYYILVEKNIIFYLLYIMKILNFSNLWVESKFVLW